MHTTGPRDEGAEAGGEEGPGCNMLASLGDCESSGIEYGLTHLRESEQEQAPPSKGVDCLRIS